MNTQEIFNKYAEENKLSKKSNKIFEQLSSNYEYDQDIIKPKKFQLVELSIKNFGNVEDDNIKFDNIVALVGEPRWGKTARIESLLWVLFGNNKTSNHISNNGEKTKVTLKFKIGKTNYTIVRTNKNKTNNAKIYANDQDEAEVSGQTECSAWVEESLQLTYNDVLEYLYVGDLSVPLHYRKPMDIKNTFMSLIDHKYWSYISKEAFDKVKELEEKSIKYNTIVESIEDISGSNEEDLVKEFDDNKEELKKLKEKYKWLDKHEKEHSDSVNKINKEINNISDNAPSISNHEHDIKNLEQLKEYLNSQEFNNNLIKLTALEKKKKELDEKLIIVTQEGKNIKSVLEQISDGVCPVIQQKCDTISDKFLQEQKKKKEQLLKEYKEYSDKLKKCTIDIYNLKNNLESNAHNSYGDYHHPQQTIETISKEIENKKSELKKRQEADKQIKKLQADREELGKTHTNNTEELSETNSNIAILEARNEVINDSLNRIKEANKFLKQNKNIKSEIKSYQEVYEACQKNNIPRVQAMQNIDTIARRMKNFCKNILPFQKYHFDDNAHLFVDDKSIKLHNSASKRIFEIAFKYSFMKLVNNRIPMLIIDDIGLSQDDKSMNELIEYLKNKQDIDYFIYSTNRNVNK